MIRRRRLCCCQWSRLARFVPWRVNKFQLRLIGISINFYSSKFSSACNGQVHSSSTTINIDFRDSREKAELGIYFKVFPTHPRRLSRPRQAEMKGKLLRIKSVTRRLVDEPSSISRVSSFRKFSCSSVIVLTSVDIIRVSEDETNESETNQQFGDDSARLSAEELMEEERTVLLDDIAMLVINEGTGQWCVLWVRGWIWEVQQPRWSEESYVFCF